MLRLLSGEKNPMPCDPSFLANIKMFELLNEDDRVALSKVVDELKVPAGHTLFQAGDPGDSLFVVQSGQIELFIKDTAGQKIVLMTAEPGDMFGELAMLDTGPRTATALALPGAGSQRSGFALSKKARSGAAHAGSPDRIDTQG
jgi:hypothetical protein